ncbi:MAG: DUF1848 domain-containing protein [Alphaproteobacteria bacterium]|nr:DUF1848 domain-containing protein [Alphaproteobacteria bacterium]
MIVSASYRTDIPAFYGDWFMKRLAAGHALVANPYGGKPYRVSLAAGEVDGFVFWTRNIGPLRDRLGEVAAIAPFMVQFTVTGYPRALEPGVIGTETAVAQIHDLSDSFGKRAAVWRYDPIVETSSTPPDWHRENFSRLAEALSGYVDEVTISFAQVYAKTSRNMDIAAREHGFSWRDPADEEKRALAGALAEIAISHGMRLTVCSQPEFLAEGAAAARCIDAGRLSDIAGREIGARVKGNRPGCLCNESRDIGAYDSCPQGCAYCYAVSSRERAKRFLAAHDPEAEALGQLA